MEPGFAEVSADRYAAGPNDNTVSTIRDICNGEVSEVLELSGAVTRIGAANGVPTPTHDFLQAALMPMELKARGELDYALNGVIGEERETAKL